MVLQRERLHAMLDARLPGAVWLHGPTGAGKTVLLRSYLQRTEQPSIWLTADERHADPAALFAAITALAGSVGGARAPARFPVFSPEHRDDPAAFARGYFEKLDGSLPSDQAFVIDDVHCLAGTTALLLTHAIDAFRGRRTLCFASQLMPDPAFASHLAGSRLWVVGHQLLAFDSDEARELAAQLGTAAPATDTLDTLVTATDGWAAGLMLAMQLGAASGSSSASTDPLESVRTPLALLIAGQVLGGVVKEDLVKLRLLAELPQAPMDLVDIAPDWASACARLQGLAERGLFVERLAADRVRTGNGNGRASAHAPNVARINKGCWRLHDLFRNALREPGAIGEPDPVVGQQLVAHLLRLDRLDLAWQLAARLGSDALDAVVVSHGSEALHDSHLPSMSLLAASHANANAPRIALWHARALLGNDNLAALEACERAYAGYEANADDEGRTFATALALFIVFGTIENIGAMTPWVQRFNAVPRPSIGGIEDQEKRAIQLAAEVMHELLVGGRSEGIEDARSMQEQLFKAVVAGSLSSNEAVLAGSLLVASLNRSKRIAEVEATIVTIESLEFYHRSAPHIRASWKVENGYHFVRLGALDMARRAYESCLTIADENSLLQPKIAAQIGLVRLELGIEALDRALIYLKELDAVAPNILGKQRGWITHLQARYAMATRNTLRAMQLLDLSQKLICEAGFPNSAMNIIEKDRIQILYAMSRFAESDAIALRLAETSTAADNELMQVINGFLQAHRFWNTDRRQAEGRLVKSMMQAEKLNLANFLPLLPAVAAQLAAYALELNVATEFIRRVIRIRRLRAPSAAPANWPWHIRVEVLGGFILKQDDEPMSFAGKAQQKPLDLLKFLACERGMIADFHSVATALWPDAEDGAARKSLEVTVSRLRKLLGKDSLVIVKESRVSLDQTQVSSDAMELAEACAEAEFALANQFDQAAVEKMSHRILTLFKGLPLDNEDPTSWREGMRERYRNAFVRAVRSLVSCWEKAGEEDRSIALIESAIAREPLAEGLYQSLIRIYIRSNQAAEAMRVYRQCRQMLSVLIGATPSRETERLKDSIHLQGV